MDVNRGRKIDKVIVLGSGESILRLSQAEKDYINNCKTVIAVNKFMAFYEKSGLLPTHIYYHDLWGANLFTFILKKCRDNNLENLTIFSNSFYKTITWRKKHEKLLCVFGDIFRYRLKSVGVMLLRWFQNCSIHKYKVFRPMRYYQLPLGCEIYSISISQWDKGGNWATKLNNKIFHFRGSLTSVLNIASIIAPEQEILLVGNDFNGSRYFYEEELNDLGVEWKDYTYDIVKRAGIHYSFQEVNGTKMEDQFPFIINSLRKTGNALYCNNKDSLLVKEAGVSYRSIL